MESNRSIKSKKFPLVLEAFIMLFAPIIGFVLYSYFSYPLNPHCELGNGLFGCTPHCTNTGEIPYGRTLCFDNIPNKLQVFSYQNPFIYYSTFLTPIAILFISLRPRNFVILSLRIAFYPLFLFKEIRKENYVSRFVCILFLFIIMIEWFIGYAVLIGSMFE